MDVAAHYRHLLTLGRDEFLAAAAPAVLVRYRATAAAPSFGRAATLTIDPVLPGAAGAPGAPGAVDARPALASSGVPAARETVDETLPHGKLAEEPTEMEMELYPLAKKPGASFPDRITIGRTTNNDVVIPDQSVSRLHAYVRRADRWLVADAGSKNGSWLGDARLEPRREAELPAGAVLRLGDVHLTFYRSADLFDLHGGDHGRR